MGIFDELMSKDLTGSDDKTSKIDTAINKIKEQGYNLSEMEGILRNTNRFQLIESVAGSGKTTTLNFKLLTDAYSGRSWGKNIWVNTFLKTGAEALKDDFFKKVQEIGISIPLNNIVFSTIHSEYYKILTSIGLKINIIPPELDRDMKNSVSKDLSIGSYPGYLNNSELQIFNLIETYVNSHIDEVPDDKLYELGLDDLSANPSSVKEAIRILHERRLISELYSYDDLQTIMYRYLVENPNPVLVDMVKNRYKFIYLDEFQDTSLIQYEIMKVYFANAEQVVFVGDSDQSIYSWRGADVKIITEYLYQDLDADLQHLTTNYRVPSNILDPIARSIKNNIGRIPKNMVSHKQGGELKVLSFDKKSKLDAEVVKLLLKEQYNDEIDQVAVLAPTNLDITELALNLLVLSKNEEIDFSIGGTVQDLNRKTYKDIWSLANLFTDNPNETLRLNLRFLSDNTLSKWNSTKIEEFIRNRGESLWNIDRQTLKEITANNFQIMSWYDFINSDQVVSENGETIEEGLGVLNSTFLWLLKIYAQRIQEQPKYTSLYEEKASKVVLFLKLISNFKIISAKMFLNEVQRLNKEIKDHYRRVNCKIVLTTPFDFKGKESDVVLIYNDTNGKFPRAKSTNFEEERKLHYIAGTRAKKKAIYTTLNGKESPFLIEMGVIDT